MTDWSKLHHAYGPATDIPDLLEQAATGPGNGAWDALASRLYHQGGVFDASYAALPALTAMARSWPVGERGTAINFAGVVVASADRPDDAEQLLGGYQAEIAQLRELTEEALRDPELVGEPMAYVNLIASLLAFEGVAGWGVHLDDMNGDEYALECPACDTENFVVFGEHGHFTTCDSRYVNRPPADAVPLRPADPADPATADALLARLHARALADGQPEVAAKLPYVFGDADCAECGEPFHVPEVILARG